MNYTQQKNHRTPTRRHDRVIPAPEAINQQRFNSGIRSEDNSTTYDELSYEEELQRVNLYGHADSYEDFDQHSEGQHSLAMTTRTTSGFDKNRNWISTSGDKKGTEFIDQWPCEIVDTDHPVIFVENRVYVGPNANDEFKCYDLGHGVREYPEEPLPPYSHSTPKQQRTEKKKKVMFEKVNYEKYRRVRSERTYSGDDDEGDEDERERNRPGRDFEGHFQCGPNECSAHNHYFSNGEIDRDEYGHKWCQDLLNWSREAAEYQRKHHRNESTMSPVLDNGSASGNTNWFQEKFRSSSSGVSRYNKMSGTEDSGVVCQFDDEEEDDDEFWNGSRSKNLASDKQTSQRQSAKESATMTTTRAVDGKEDGVDSWETLKQRVFLPAEKHTPSKLVMDSEGRLLGRRCSCNSMCTSLCTLETWVDDDVFDNTFNEELERRCGISTN